MTMTNTGCWALTSTLVLPTPAAPALIVGTRVHQRDRQDHEGEVYVLATTALGPCGATGVVLTVIRLPDKTIDNAQA